MLVRLPRAPVLSSGLRRKTQLFSGTLYMAASSMTPPYQSKGPQKFNTPFQVPVFPGSSRLCRHTSCEKPSDSTSFHSVLVCHRTSSQEVGEVKIARERRVRETRTHKSQKITRVPRDCDTRTHLKEDYHPLKKENQGLGGSELWTAPPPLSATDDVSSVTRQGDRIRTRLRQPRVCDRDNLATTATILIPR
ncbi:hypothetical protein TNCV_3481821 [Trichonephila clavipes]|nr:hypothetical protein TNCV_3481821 [Trichonephila clavipes]